MLRTLIYLLFTVFLITFLRAVVGIIGKAVAQFFQPSSTVNRGKPGTAAGGVLRQCSACGVYTSEATALRLRANGKEHFFCSKACREKFQA